MDRKTILEALEHIREIQFACWKSYQKYVRETPDSVVYREMKDRADRNVRVLDYLTEAVKKHDTV